MAALLTVLHFECIYLWVLSQSECGQSFFCLHTQKDFPSLQALDPSAVPGQHCPVVGSELVSWSPLACSKFKCDHCCIACVDHPPLLQELAQFSSGGCSLAHVGGCGLAHVSGCGLVKVGAHSLAIAGGCGLWGQADCVKWEGGLL